MRYLPLQRLVMISVISSAVMAFVVTLPANAADVPTTANLVQASILADVSTIKPGDPFNVGVLIKIKPGWHIYWTNPGDAGLPTRISWILPPGYTASELRFPIPERIEQAGGIVMYGYTNQVMLWSAITPAPASAGQSAATDTAAVAIAAKVRWLCCADECVPGNASLAIELASGGTSVPDNSKLFERWEHRLPVLNATPCAPLVLSDPQSQTWISTTRKIVDAKAIIPGAVDGMVLTVGAPREMADGITIPLSAQLLKGQTVTAHSVPILLTWIESEAAAAGDVGGNVRVGEEIDVPIMSVR